MVNNKIIFWEDKAKPTILHNIFFKNFHIYHWFDSEEKHRDYLLWIVS